MKIAVLGTGGVGQTIASRLIELGHEVRMGSRTADNEKAISWVRGAGAKGSIGTFSDAAAFGEVVFNCTSGGASLKALGAAGAGNLVGKVVIDLANPLDGSSGFPPILSVCNTDSLGEQIQAAFPEARVVKTLNTVNSDVMVRPETVPGDHINFVSGNDGKAKDVAIRLLSEFGWPEDRIIDLGDIESARGPEMYLALWLRMRLALGTHEFNITIAK